MCYISVAEQLKFPLTLTLLVDYHFSFLFIGAKKKPATTEAEYYIPTANRCPQLDDLDIFMKGSLHENFLPKEQAPTKKTQSVFAKAHTESAENNVGDISARSAGVGVITPVGFTERFENVEETADRAEMEMANYKEAKASGSENVIVRERRSRSVPESHPKNNRDKADQRSTAYHTIKRFLKLTKYDDRRLSVRLEDDEDEGYASKTSSAEAKENNESGAPELHRMFSSMIDLSELPSQDKDTETENKDKKEIESKIKFSYTHQATILQMPEAETKKQLEKERPERLDHINKTYTRLKREKELRRCATTLYEPQHIVETSTMYDLNTIKPVTLILRKISIQDSEQRMQSIIPGVKISSPSKQTASQSQSNSRANSRASSRVGSATSRVGSAVSRASSVMSRASNHDKSPRIPSRPSSRLAMRSKTFREENATKTKEPTWCPKHSHVTLFNRQHTYSIGDLLPAVDKNIYNKQMHVNRTYDSGHARTEQNTPDFNERSKSSQEDGYMLLQKGMDILTGSTEKVSMIIGT